MKSSTEFVNFDTIKVIENLNSQIRTLKREKRELEKKLNKTDEINEYRI